MTTKVLNKLVNICTNLDSGTSSSDSSSSEMTTVSKSNENLGDNFLAFMKLRSWEINKFEGLVSCRLSTTQGVTFEMYIYLKILAFGEFIINPIICTFEVSQESTDVFIKLMKVQHNESGEILLCLALGNTDSYEASRKEIVIEGRDSKTNSPTDYETLSSDDWTVMNITDSTTYYSTINYSTWDNYIIMIYSKVGFSTG